MRTLQTRLAASETSESKTEAQKLYDAYQEACALGREADRLKKELRPEIDALLAQGELVGYPDAYLALQESVKLSADMDALVADLGPTIALRVCEVSSTKLKALVETGLVPADAPYLTKTVATSVVTKTVSK